MERFRRLGVANLIPRTRLFREEGDGQSTGAKDQRSERRCACTFLGATPFRKVLFCERHLTNLVV
jgi:hypothetical protein